MAMNDSTSNQGTVFEPVFVARQPIFDRDRRVWGYELLFRHSAKAQCAQVLDSDVATSTVMIDGFAMAQEWLLAQQRVLINYPASLLLQHAPLALPAETAVVEILETVRPDEDILSACRHLKEEGYTLALDDFVGGPGYEPLLELADIVKVDILGMSNDQMEQVVRGLQRYDCTLLAEKVEDNAVFKHCRDLGFNLFQGYFFSRPEIIPGRKLSSSQLSKLQLLKELSVSDVDMPKISRIIQADVSVSYRLLRYINSPFVGLRSQVSSISQAVVLLGQKKVAVWLRVLLLADLNPSPQAAELMFLSLQRAKFLELLTGELQLAADQQNKMFLLGLFSFLDVLLSQPVGDIIPLLALEDDLAGALVGEDTHLSFWLKFVQVCERGQWPAAEAILQKLGLSTEQTAKALSEATLWARRFLSLS